MPKLSTLASSTSTQGRDRTGIPFSLAITGALLLLSFPISHTLESSPFVETLTVSLGLCLLLLAFLRYRHQREIHTGANLQEAESRYKRLFDEAVEGIYQSTADGRFLSVNPALVSMLGYDSAEQLLSQSFDISRDLFFEPEKRNEIISDLETLGCVTDLLVKGKRKDGTVVWLSINARSELDDVGNIIFDGFARDVTEAEENRQEALESRQALILSEQRNRTFINSIPDLMIWYSSEGIYKEVILRDWYTPVSKFSADEVIGKHISEVLPPDLANLVLKNLKKALETGEMQSYRWGPSATGAYSEARAAPGPDGNVLVISHDITKEVLTEMALLRRDAIMSAIGFSTEQLLRTNSWQDVIQPVLKRLGEATSNVASVSIFEAVDPYDEMPTIELRHQWIADELTSPSTPHDLAEESQLNYIREWYERLRDDEVVYEIVAELPNGALSDMLAKRGVSEFLLLPITVGEKWWGFIGFDINSAEHVWSSQEHDALRIAAANLGAAIEREQTQRAFLEVQKSESIGVLAGGIAHDFNNLLTGVIGQSSLAEAKLGPEHPATKHVGRAVRSAKKAANLTKQLLAYAGKGQIIVLPIDLNNLVLENVELFSTALPANVSVSYALDAVNSVIVADKVHMQQLIMNLVINAGDAMSESGGQLVVTTCNERLVEPLKDPRFRGTQELDPGDYFVLEVSDTGTGMSDLTVSKIFDPYFSTKETGHGLGLSATLGIVNTLSGALLVQTAIGKGTTFSIWLPLDSE